MVGKLGKSLTDFSHFPAEARDNLAELWITTAEELVAITVSNGGIRALARYLDIGEDEVARLAGSLRTQIPGSDEATGFIRAGGLLQPTNRMTEDASDTNASLEAAPLLPAQSNLLEQMPPVRDQGRRATSVAFASVALREFMLLSTGQAIDLSEEYLYWDCKQNDDNPNAGTYLHIAMRLLCDHGVCPEADWPYSLEADVLGSEPPPIAHAHAAQYRVTKVDELNPRSLSELWARLEAGQPVCHWPAHL